MKVTMFPLERILETLSAHSDLERVVFSTSNVSNCVPKMSTLDKFFTSHKNLRLFCLFVNEWTKKTIDSFRKAIKVYQEHYPEKIFMVEKDLSSVDEYIPAVYIYENFFVNPRIGLFNAFNPDIIKEI